MKLPLKDDAFAAQRLPDRPELALADLFRAPLLQQQHVDKHGKL